MNVPGFTAETSLYARGGQFHVTRRQEHATGTVRAQYEIFTPYAPPVRTYVTRPLSRVFEPLCRTVIIYNGGIRLCQVICSDGSRSKLELC
jgi:hypothetical protein